MKIEFSAECGNPCKEPPYCEECFEEARDKAMETLTALHIDEARKP